MSPEKAMRRALSRTADVLWDLVLVTKEVVCDSCDQPGVEASFREGELLVLLDGPDGAIGFVSIARDVMASVIEVQTIGQVTKMAIADRVLTHTDAAMVAPLIEGALERLVQNLEDNPICDTVSGFRFGAMIEDPRAAALLLEAPSYLTFRAEVDLALGRRRGEILFTFPVMEHKPNGPHGHRREGEKGPFEDALMMVDADLETILCKVTLPLAKLRSLAVGDQLALPLDCHNRVELRSQEGRVIAGGTLGQANGKRAVRLSWPTLQGETAAPPAEAVAFAATEGLDDTAHDAIDLTPVEPDLDGAPINDPASDMQELPALGFDDGDFGNSETVEDPDMSGIAEPSGIDIGDFGEDITPDTQKNGAEEPATSLDDFDFTSDFSLPDPSDET